MVRAPCCEKVGLKQGRWTAEEDEILRKYVETKGEGSWKSLPKIAGLKRCGKSCRLRWVNYLRGDLKKENFTSEEDHIIVKMYNTFGSRWSMMARNLPGRTDNEIKNYWNSHLSRSVHTFRRPSGEYPTTIAIDIVKMRRSKRKGRTSRAAMKKKSYIMNKNPHNIPSNAEKMSVCGIIPSIQIQEATLKNGKEESEQNRFIQGPTLESCVQFTENITGDGMLSLNEKDHGVNAITMSEEQLGLLCSHSSMEGESGGIISSSNRFIQGPDLESCMLFAENIMGSSSMEGEIDGIISSSSNIAADQSTSDQWYSCFEDDWVNLIIEGPNNNDDEQEFVCWLWDHDRC